MIQKKRFNKTITFILLFAMLMAVPAWGAVTNVPTEEDVTAALEEMEAAEIALEAAKAEKIAAESELIRANEELEKCIAALESARLELAEYEVKLIEAEAEYVKAKEVLEEAKAKAETPDYSQTAEYLAYVEAQEVRKNAEARYAECEEALKNANKEYGEAVSKLEEAQLEHSELSVGYNKLANILAERQEKLEESQTEYKNIQSQYRLAVELADQANREYEEAVATATAAEETLLTAQKWKEEAETSLKEYDETQVDPDLLQQLVDIEVENNYAAFSFFAYVAADETQSEAVRQNAQDALDWLNYAKDQGWIAASGSATSISNMQLAITNLYRCNTVLSSEGVRTLDVSLWLMAHAQVSSDRNQMDPSTPHHLVVAGAENQFEIGDTSFDPYEGWYYAEKELKEAGETVGIGHYENLISTSETVTGYGISSAYVQENSIHYYHIQQFAGDMSYEDVNGFLYPEESAMTVSQYESLLNTYINDYTERLTALKNADLTRVEMVQNLEAAELAVKEAEEVLPYVQAAVDGRLRDKENADYKVELNNNILVRAEINYNSAYDQYVSIKDETDRKLVEIAVVESNIEAYKKAKEKASEAIASTDASLETANNELNEAREAESVAKYAYDVYVNQNNQILMDEWNQASYESHLAQRQVEVLKEKIKESSNNIVDAEEKVSIARVMLIIAQERVDEVADISKEEQAVQEATSRYHQIKAAYDAAHQPIQTGWVLEEDTWYYYDADGSMHIGWLYVNNSWYYLDESGAMVTGLQIVDGRMSHFNAGGVWEGYVSKGWRKDCGNWYYVGLNGELAKGWKQVGGIWYYMNEEGVMQTGWQKIGGVWYFLNSSGAMVTGWQQIGKTWYYFSPSGAMKTGWLQQGNVWYYLNSSGAMVTGDVMIDGALNCFNAQGVWKGYAAPGWKLLNQKWYYVNGGGKVATGWKLLGNTWYFFNESGVMQTGWQKIGGVWYFLNSSGAMVTGWQQIGKTWYYFRTSGAMVTGTVELSGVTYTFSDSGAWIQ